MKQMTLKLVQRVRIKRQIRRVNESLKRTMKWQTEEATYSQAIQNQSCSLNNLQLEQSRRQGTTSFIIHSIVLSLSALLR